MNWGKQALPLLAVLGALAPMQSLHSQLPDAPAPASTPSSHTTPAAASSREGYVGDEACRSCHQQDFDTNPGSPHHLASRMPDQTSIDGQFTPGSNILRTSNPYFYFVMNATREGFFQRAVAQFPPSETISQQERFDVVIGSGRKGQTYLYWKGDELFELPVSYWTETHQWMNSPGYPDGLPNFDKPIAPRCLECHATYIQSLSPPLNRFDRKSMVLGISCEKCHGPGRAHVEGERSGKALPAGAADIINPASLSRERQMDLCALCHSGPGTGKLPAFSFVPGAMLGNYLTRPTDPDDTLVDVHAHQVQLLEGSRCFQSSSMTCITCHDVHQAQRDVAYFSARCVTCHRVESCGRYKTMGTQILNKCVDCHMPLKESDLIVFDADGHQVKPRVRSHRIAIY